jgi:hypothetical protein
VSRHALRPSALCTATLATLALLVPHAARAAQAPKDPDGRALAAAITQAVTAAVNESVREATRAVNDALSDLPRDLNDTLDAKAGRRQGRSTPRTDAVDKQTRTLDLGASGVIDVVTSGGNITVTAGTGPATLEVARRVSGRAGSTSRGTWAPSLYSIQERPGSVRLRSGDDDVSFTLVVPAETEIHARTNGGAIMVTGVHGALDARSSSGAITLSKVGSVSTAQSISGPVTLTDVDTTEDVIASTVSATLTLTRVKAARLALSTIEGDIVATDVGAKFATVKTSSGSLSYRGPLVHNGHYELKTHSGSVRFEPTGTIGFDVEATTFSGAIEIDSALKIKLTGKAGSRRTFTGTQGDGDATVELSTFSGSVTIGKNGRR